MSKVVADLLNQPQHLVSKTISRLEEKNGFPSHDARHLANNIQKTRAKIAELGLDPNDTTGEELYQVLLSKFQRDSRLFDAENQAENLNFNQTAAKAVELGTKTFEIPQRWVLKNSTAKSLLKNHIPKKLMKQLNYRSIESMLKRESVCELWMAATFLESPSWLKDQAKLVSKLDSTAFELKQICLGYLSDKKWGLFDVSTEYSDEVGYLAVLNSNDPQIPLLSMVVLLAESLAGLSAQSFSAQISKLSPLAAWWIDMDGLIANLNSEHVSLNIKDVSRSHSKNQAYADRSLKHARHSFWHELVSRYDNQLEIQEDHLLGLSQRIVNSKPPPNQPAFEYAEEF